MVCFILIDFLKTYGIKGNVVSQTLYTFFLTDNVNEYLKLAANADKQQLQRIKAVFEKKNQKSAQSISQLQKKLESYNKKLRDLEMHGLSSTHRQPREMLRDMGQGLKWVNSYVLFVCVCFLMLRIGGKVAVMWWL